MSDVITESSARLDIALSAWRQDPGRADHHLDAALAATGDLQRALIAERMRMDEPTRKQKKTPDAGGPLNRVVGCEQSNGEKP